jgi:hypothetical protein
LIILIFMNCKSVLGLRYDESIEKINGKWIASCETFPEAPEEFDCPEFDESEQIKINKSTGSGVIILGPDFIDQEVNVKVYKKNKKLFIDYYLSETEKMKGEIIKLNDEEFVVKFEKEKFYSIRKKKKNK